MAKYFFALLFFALLFTRCNPKTELKTAEQDTIPSKGSIDVSEYGKLPTGEKVMLFTLTNGKGLTMGVINYGGIITSIEMPDKDGVIEDIVLGYDSLDSYVKSSPYFGALIGRYGNRIAKGKFSLDGKTYSLAVNNGDNHLHGGVKGFDKVFWEIDTAQVANGVAVRLRYVSKDMEEGYPGTLRSEVIYNLTDNNELKITYNALTDKKTVVNLTQHTYFNLSSGKRDILEHELLINADKFLPVDKGLIPTGEQREVKGTPFDFTTPMAIGSRIENKDQQLEFGNGYDHNWILNKSTEGIHHAATLYDSVSRREVVVYTTEPGIQFYSGNFLDGSLIGKGDVKYNFRTGLCLETQHFPDSPNKPEFPSVTLEPGDTYRSETIYKFSVR